MLRTNYNVYHLGVRIRLLLDDYNLGVKWRAYIRGDGDGK